MRQRREPGEVLVGLRAVAFPKADNGGFLLQGFKSC